MTVTPFYFGIGDDWVLPITYRNPAAADGTPGAPIDLTGSVVGAELYFSRFPTPVAELTVANGGIIAETPTAGTVTFLVPSALTATALADKANTKQFPNRLQVWVVDSLGHRETIAIFPISVFDPRTVDPATLPQNQTGTVVSAGAQGPAGPAGIVTINGKTGVAVTLGAHDVGAYTQAEADAALAAPVTLATQAVAAAQAALAAADDAFLDALIFGS